MFKFYFDVYEHLIAKDEDGGDYPDPQAARLSAIDAARSIAVERALEGHFCPDGRIDVVNEAHELVFRIRFDEVASLGARH